MSVLVTGAAGRIGRMLAARLPGRGWTLRGLDRVGPPPGHAGYDAGYEAGHEAGYDGGFVVGDINDPAVLEQAFADGVEAVVHLGGQPVEAPWPVIRTANIEGTFAVFEAARRHGVRRIVYASSNHAVGRTPRAEEVPDDLPPRPDTLYGVSKVFGEALARYYVERYGLQVACLRIGSCNEAPTTHRELATWCSPDDIAGLVDAALRAPTLTFAIAWAVSANRERWWSTAGMRSLGYTPKDDAAALFPGIAALAAEPGEAFVGGEFTTDAFGIDEIAAG